MDPVQAGIGTVSMAQLDAVMPALGDYLADCEGQRALAAHQLRSRADMLRLLVLAYKAGNSVGQHHPSDHHSCLLAEVCRKHFSTERNHVSRHRSDSEACNAHGFGPKFQIKVSHTDIVSDSLGTTEVIVPLKLK